MKKAYEEIFLAMEETEIGPVRSWDNHSPCLYRLLIKLYDEKDELMEAVPYLIGFRNLEIKK